MVKWQCGGLCQRTVKNPILRDYALGLCRLSGGKVMLSISPITKSTMLAHRSGDSLEMASPS